MPPPEKAITLPLPTIRRYPAYLRAIRDIMVGGSSHISSAVVAEIINLDPVLVRKDLAMVGVTGMPRRGYPAEELQAAMVHALGWDNTTDAVLVGVGSLGRALLGYSGFEERSLKIAIAFDNDPAKTTSAIGGVKVRPMSDLIRLVKRMKLRLGILTVPAAAAQECADQLVAAGIRGIWNFSRVRLSVPPNVIVQNVDLAESLAVLSHKILRA